MAGKMLRGEIPFSKKMPERKAVISPNGENRTNNQKQGSKDKPNIIFFALDDLNDWINPLGYHQAITPNLDRLAASGVTFTNAHAPASYCAPSRSAIFTGLQSTTTGCYGDEVYHFDHPELTPLQVSFK